MLGKEDNKKLDHPSNQSLRYLFAKKKQKKTEKYRQFFRWRIKFGIATCGEITLLPQQKISLT